MTSNLSAPQAKRAKASHPSAESSNPLMQEAVEAVEQYKFSTPVRPSQQVSVQRVDVSDSRPTDEIQLFMSQSASSGNVVEEIRLDEDLQRRNELRKKKFA